MERYLVELWTLGSWARSPQVLDMVTWQGSLLKLGQFHLAKFVSVANECKHCVRDAFTCINSRILHLIHSSSSNVAVSEVLYTLPKQRLKVAMSWI